LHQQTCGITWDLEIVTKLAERHPGPVLDIGCGRGRIALALAERGAHVRAVDSSPAVITKLRATLASSGRPGSRVTPVHGDLLDPRTDLGTGNGLAVLGDVAINMFARPEQASHLLRRVRASLAPDAVFALPILTAEGISRYARRNGVLADEFTDDSGRQHIVFGSMRYEPDGPYFSRTLFSQQDLAGTGPVRVYLACIRERLWTWSTLRPLVHAAGLELAEREAVHADGPVAEVLVLTPREAVTSKPAHACAGLI